MEKTKSEWTVFFDMSSGGPTKLDWDVIIIEARRPIATAAFESLFGRNPHNVTCECCGEDYSIHSAGSEKDARDLFGGTPRNTLVLTAEGLGDETFWQEAIREWSSPDDVKTVEGKRRGR